MLKPAVNHSAFKIDTIVHDAHYSVAYNTAVLYPEAYRYIGSYVNVHCRSASQFWNRHHTFYVYTHRTRTTAQAKEGMRGRNGKHVLKAITF
jgi:hypothetical protein